MKFKQVKGALAALLFTAALATGAVAQNTNSGDIRGTATDTTGAVLPDVTVTVTNIDTGISKDYVTNQDGLYDTGSILLGTYKLTFTKAGFSQLVREGVTLQVGLTMVNGALAIGAATDQVVVNTDVPLLSTETGEQSTTLEAKSMAQLPNVGQDWENFAILLPGASGLGVNAQGQVTSYNGNLPYNSMLADGATTTLSHSSNSDVSIFETVQEVQISTSSFSAQYGIGGAIFNQISKGGTNKFHGSAYEYFQNDALNAASYSFGQTRQQAIGFERYNNFGGSIGGPIFKNKMFFYFNYDQTIDHGAASTGYETVPTDAMRAGDFTGLPTLYDPTTQRVVNGVVTRTSFADEYGNGNKIPTALLDPVAAAIQAYYPKANSPGTLLSTGQVQNNFFYNVANSNPYRKYFGRYDYDISSNNRLTMSDTQRDNPAVFQNQGICPINCQTGDVDSNNAQVSDVWNISANTINEARMGFTYQGNFYQPESLGKGYPAKLGWQFAKADTFPDIQVNGAGSCCYELGPQSNAVYKEMGFDPSDVVTMIRGKHVLHFGGEFLFYRDDSTAWGNTNAGQMGYSGAYTRSTNNDTSTGAAYADFLLGQTAYWNAGVTPEYGAREKSPQMFVQDDIKLRPNLTVNLGLRYQIQTGWKEVKGNEATFDPTVENPATNTLGAFWYGSTKANGRNSIQSNVYNIVLPRVGFSYQVHPDTVVRGGFGVYSYNWSLDTYGQAMGGAFGSKGSVSDTTNGVSPVVILSGTGSNLPYIAATTDPSAYNGTDVNYNQYHTPVPKIYQWNIGVQQEIGTNMVAGLSYVASHGFDLNFPVDLNQVPGALLGPNDVSSRPYTQYGHISGSTNNSISNYNSLQATLQKRMTNGFSFDFNYTWAHFLDDQDSSGWGSREGTQVYQNAYNPSANYGNSNFDIQNAFKARFVYDLPFGKGKMFLNKNWIADEAIGGWQLSSTIVLQSGVPFTVTAPDTSNSQASNGYQQFPNLIGNPKLQNANINHWFNEAAFVPAPAYSFGDERRNNLFGPNLQQVNASLGKVFHIWESTQLQIRCDATNVINHPGFGNPSTGLTAGATLGTFQTGTSTITGTTIGGRTLQLGARLSF
jgi:hypothetical protein